MGSPNSAYGTLQLLVRILIYVAIVVFVVTSFLAYVETAWMKAEVKSEAKQLRKLRDEVREYLKEKNEKTAVPKSGTVSVDGL